MPLRDHLEKIALRMRLRKSLTRSRTINRTTIRIQPNWTTRPPTLQFDTAFQRLEPTAFDLGDDYHIVEIVAKVAGPPSPQPPH
jgi:hypothetical protein